MGATSKLVKIPSAVSFHEENNMEFLIPRYRKKDKKKLWMTSKDIDSNFKKEKLRNLVEHKLTFLIDSSEELSDVDTSCIEYNHYDTCSEQKSEEDILRHKKSLIIDNLLESIMERPKKEIRSFLTSHARVRLTPKE